MTDFDNTITVFKTNVQHLDEQGNPTFIGESTQLHETYDDALAFLVKYNQQVAGIHASRCFIGLAVPMTIRELISYQRVDFQGMTYYYLPKR